jgi:DNA polymerase I-like protein with 3'-5' exonuclease and polymerase domains
MTATQGVNKATELPRLYRGEPILIHKMGRKSRGEFGLATEDTIVEVVGQQHLVEQAAEYARKKGLVGFDCETGGLNPWTDELSLVQIGDKHKQFLIWAQTVDMTPIIKVLNDEKVCKVGVNLKFDLRFFLAKYGYEARGKNVVDCMLIEQLLGCGLFSEDDDSVGQALALTGMGQMARRWMGWVLPKDEALRTGWDKMTPGDWSGFEEVTYTEEVDGKKEKRTEQRSRLAKKFYAADDVVIPLLLIQKQKPWIKRLGLVETVNLEHAFLPVLTEMEIRGVRVDMDKWDGLCVEAETKVREAKRALDRLFDVTVTIEVDEDGNATYSRDKKYTSTNVLKELIRDYMWEHHGLDVILSNKHLKESLLEAKVPEERVEKLFNDARVQIEKLRASKNIKSKKKKTIGGPNSNDLVPTLWPRVSKYLDKGAFFVTNTESKTFKLYRVIHETPRTQVDTELPSRTGLPPALVDPVLDLRKYSKAAGTYGRNWHKLVNEATKRLHCNFIQAALTTGRLSSTPNFQNLPKDKRYRNCFVPAEGYKYVGADWSQIEPRIIAQLSGDPAYMRVFWSEFPGTEGFERYCSDVSEPLDLYTEIGKMVGVIPQWMTLKDVKGDTATEEGEKGRAQSKVVVLGLGYGTGVPKFWRGLIVDTGDHHTKDFAAQLHGGFWNIVPSMKKTLDAFSADTDPVKSRRRVMHPFIGDAEITFSRTIGGRKRFYRPDSWKWWTTGRNHPIQGTGADIMKKTAVLLSRWMWDSGIDGGIVNLIHDEILAEVRDDQAEMVKEKMQELMRTVGESYCPEVPVTASSYVDVIWKKD